MVYKTEFDETAAELCAFQLIFLKVNEILNAEQKQNQAALIEKGNALAIYKVSSQPSDQLIEHMQDDVHTKLLNVLDDLFPQLTDTQVMILRDYIEEVDELSEQCLDDSEYFQAQIYDDVSIRLTMWLDLD